MRHLLADETRDLRGQLRVGDPVGVVAHRTDEEVFPFWEHRREHGDDVTHHQITLDVMPVHGPGGVVEADAAGADAARGHGGCRVGGAHRSS